MVKRFKSVINPIKKVGTVRKQIQYGEFEENNFKIFGIQDYEKDDEGSLKLHYKLRGIDLYKDEFNAESDDFHIAYRFKLPFERENAKL